jgi:hypothetical protein
MNFFDMSDAIFLVSSADFEIYFMRSSAFECKGYHLR